MASAASSCPDSIAMGSFNLSHRTSLPSATARPRPPPPPTPKRHSISTSPLTLLTKATPPSPVAMDRSYYARPSSPGGRRIANPERASAHQLGNHDHYYGGPRASREYIDPRSSGERVIVPHTHQYNPHAPPSSTASRSTANFSAYSGRPRRSTLEGNSTRPSSVSHSSRNRPAVIHAAHENRPSSPLAWEDGHRGREHAYPPPPPTSAPKVPHKKVYSVDDGRSRLIEEADIVPRRERRSSVERNNHKSTHVGGSRQSYYPNVPVVAPRDTEQYYSYTDAAKMYTETEPSWRPRGNSMERKSRPSSVIIEPSVGAAAPKSAREYGPPVSTRGFDRIHGSTGLTRSGSLRDGHHRTSSRERDRQSAYTQVSRDNTLDPYVHAQDLALRSNSALSAPRNQHDTRPVDAYRDHTYDEPRSGRNHHRRSTYEDPDVATRGFGIRSGSHDRHGRDTSIDRHVPHAPAPPPDSVTIPDPRSYIPDTIAQPIPPPPPRDGRDGRREYDRVERDWAPTVDRERDREHRDRPREHKERDRDYDKERDRPRDRDRERDRDDRDKHRDRDDRDRYYERDERARRDKDHGDRDGRDARDYLPAAAIAGGAAAAAGAYGLHKAEKDDRRDDSRRYEDEGRRAPADDRRAAPIPVPADFRPPPPPEDRRPPPQNNLDYYPPPPPPVQDNRGVPLSDIRRAPPIPPPASQAPVDDRRPPQTEYRGASDDRGAVAQERPQAKQQSSDTEVPVRQRHYVDRDAERDAGGRQDSKRSEAVDADEDYRRRLQAAQADLQRSASAVPALAQRSAVRDSRREAPDDRDSSGSDRERRRRDRGYGSEHDRLNVERAPAVPSPISAPNPGPPGAYPADVPPPPRSERSERSERSDRSHRDREVPSRAPLQSDQPRDLNSTVLGQHFVQDPEEYDEPERDRKVSIVAPPRESPPPVRGILRKPTEKFPEDPNPIREGVAPMKDAKKGKDIPVNARWTKIDRRLVNPDALKEAKERFEERMDCVIVLRVLSKEDIQKLADRTRELRERREDDEGNYKFPLRDSDLSIGQFEDYDAPATLTGEARDDWQVEYNTKINEYSGPAAKNPANKLAHENAMQALQIYDPAPSPDRAVPASTSSDQATQPLKKSSVSSDLRRRRSSAGQSTSDARLESSNTSGKRFRDIKQALNPFKSRERSDSASSATKNTLDLGNSQPSDRSKEEIDSAKAPTPTSFKPARARDSPDLTTPPSPRSKRSSTGLSSSAKSLLSNLLTPSSAKGDDRYRDDRERDLGRDDQERERDREHRRRRRRERRQGDETDDTEGSEYDTDRERRREKARQIEATPDEERSREYVR